MSEVERLDDLSAWHEHDGTVWRPLVCPVCGAVVNQSSAGTHWDWHKATA